MYTFHLSYLLDGLKAPGCGSGRVLEDEQPPVRMLFLTQLHAEPDVYHRLTQLPLDLHLGHLRIVEEALQR